jgi:hypothetical protein
MSDQQQQHEPAPDNFELMDKEDEEQILAELRGVPVDKFIYKNTRGEWDLSYAGTKWVVRKMAEEGEAIRVDSHPEVKLCIVDPEYITCTVLGRRVKVNVDTKHEILLDTNVGAARSWTKQKLRDGSIKPDEFFFNKTTSKAIRNLQQALIPPDFKKAMIQKLVSQSSGSGGAGGAQRPANQGQQTQQRPAQGTTQGSQGATQGSGNQAAQPGQTGQTGQQKPQGQQKTQQKTQAPAGQQGQQGQQNKADGASIETVQQHFKAVFVAFAKSDDKPTLQKILKEMSGKIAITDLSKEFMAEVGPLLRQCINQKAKWTGKAFIQIPSNVQIWPKVEQRSEPEPAPEPQHEEAPQPQEEPMF